MLYVVDGSNVLGRLGGLTDEDAKRQLITRLSRWAREKRARVICFFDGPAPPAFATSLGAVQVRFNPGKSADDAIVALVSGQKTPVTLVSADLALFARVRSRAVQRADPSVLLESTARNEEGSRDQVDWDEYFSDPKNRNV